jgi:hypothetical protein
MKEGMDIDPQGLMKGFMPSGLSGEAQQMLLNARAALKQRKKVEDEAAKELNKQIMQTKNAFDTDSEDEMEEFED